MTTKSTKSAGIEKPGGKNDGGPEVAPDPRLVQMVCCAYCNYFKGTGGEPECGGYTAVARAAASGTITEGQMEKVGRRQPVPSERIKVLTENLCAACGYRKDACDFQSSSPPEGTTPCGGYRVFQVLLNNGDVGEEELGKILSGQTEEQVQS